MVRTISMICCALLIVESPGFAAAAEKERDLASETLTIFAAKCAGCHGPNLTKPRGRFGYVLDLGRVAGNREMVVPSSPEESELWDLVNHNEMPPADSPTGPLSASQKEVIRAWIAAGAPASSRSTTGHKPESERPENMPASSAPAQVLRRIGSLHVVIVHFPIALLMAAVMGELWFAFRSVRIPTQPVRFCLLLGTAFALAAAALGWLQAWNGNGAGMPQILRLHRWLGTATALWSIIAVLLSELDERRGSRSLWFRVWLLMGAVLVAATGHLGGLLVHGEDYFSGR